MSEQAFNEIMETKGLISGLEAGLDAAYQNGYADDIFEYNDLLNKRKAQLSMMLVQFA